MNDHLGVDILVSAADFSGLPTGDAELVQGLRCLLQDLVLRLSTPRGDHWMHPTYGLDIYRFLHLEASAVNVLDFRRAVEQEVEEDPRVVPSSARCEVLGWARETLRFRVTFRPVGAANPLSFVLGYDVSSITAEVVRGH